MNMPKLKPALAVVGAAFFLNFTSVGSAIAAYCSADAAIIYKKIVGSFTPFLNNLITTTGLGLEQAIVEAGAGTQAEISKAAMANKAVDEGLEAYRTEQELREEALALEGAMQQPPTTCQTLATASSLGSATLTSQQRVFQGQERVLERLAGNAGSGKVLEVAHQDSNRKFCTPEEKARGVCELNSNPAYSKLAGADQDAAFLFQSKDGNASYDGLDTGAARSPQSEAVDSYISRVVAALPPEQLRDKGEAYYKKSPQARAYVELGRRYDAMQSAAAYSLNQIKEYHRPQAGLGAATQLATILAPNYTPGKNDMSEAEVVERFVATKFSPDSVKALAGAIEPNMILRDLAQMHNFQLRMSFQAMLQSSRTESLAAHQLALMAEQTLRPQIDAQRSAATKASVTSRQGAR